MATHTQPTQALVQSVVCTIDRNTLAWCGKDNGWESYNSRRTGCTRRRITSPLCIRQLSMTYPQAIKQDPGWHTAAALSTCITSRPLPASHATGHEQLHLTRKTRAGRENRYYLPLPTWELYQSLYLFLLRVGNVPFYPCQRSPLHTVPYSRTSHVVEEYNLQYWVLRVCALSLTFPANTNDSSTKTMFFACACVTWNFHTVTRFLSIYGPISYLLWSKETVTHCDPQKLRSRKRNRSFSKWWSKNQRYGSKIRSLNLQAKTWITADVFSLHAKSGAWNTAFESICLKKAQPANVLEKK